MDFIPVFSLCQTPGKINKDKGLGSGRTFRTVFPVNVNGHKIRFVFKNFHPRIVGEVEFASVALADENGRIHPETSVAITLKGSSFFDILPAETKISDEIDFPIKIGDWIAISIFCTKIPGCGNAIFPYMHYSFDGNRCLNAYVEEVGTDRSFHPELDMPFISMVEVMTDNKPKIISCFGDSITQQGFWFTVVQKKLYANYPGKVIMLNAGIGGNRLLSDSSPEKAGKHGRSGIRRISEDVFCVKGVRFIIFSLGINDLMHAESPLDAYPIPSVYDYAEGLDLVIKRAKKADIPIYALTIYPATLDSNPKNASRRHKYYLAYNEAIRSAGFDSVLEVEKILGFSNKQGYREEWMHQPDGLHLTPAGGEFLAEKIYNWIKPQVDGLVFNG